MIYVSELLQEVCQHDQVILDLLQSKDSCGLTTIQISNELKRARSDVKFSMDRLLQAKKVKRGSQFNYGRWTLVGYDFTEQIINKRPNEAADTMRKLTEENAKLREALKKAHDWLKVDYGYLGSPVFDEFEQLLKGDEDE